MLTVSEYCSKYPEIFAFDSEELSDDEIEYFILSFIINHFNDSEHTKQLINITEINWKNKKYNAIVTNIYKNYRKYYSKSYKNEDYNKLKFSLYLATLHI